MILTKTNKMDSLFTATTSQPDMLHDIYFMSCKSSQPNRKNTNTVKLPGCLILAITLTCSSGAYASESFSQDIVETPITIEQLSSSLKTGSLIPIDHESHIELNITPSPRFNRLSRRDITTQESYTREMLLMSSYKKNTDSKNIPYRAISHLFKTNSILSKLAFNDAIVQYNRFEECWHYNLFFNHSLEISLGVYDDEELSDVDFSIYHDNELIVSSYLPINHLVKRVQSIITRIENNGK